MGLTIKDYGATLSHPKLWLFYLGKGLHRANATVISPRIFFENHRKSLEIIGNIWKSLDHKAANDCDSSNTPT